MEIEVVPVTGENEGEILSLRVAEGQRGYIETTAQCLEEARALSLWRPVGLLADGRLVGFAMYGLWKEEGAGGRVWLDRFLIDARFQGRGCGRAALPVLLRRIFEEYGQDELYLSLVPENLAAARLYRSFGFRFNGETDPKGERVMVLNFHSGEELN